MTNQHDPDKIVANLDDPLPGLAAEANQGHEEVQTGTQSIVMGACRAGNALLAAKKLLRHGEWLPWLEANFDGDASTATRYMQIANHARVHDLDPKATVTETLRAISVLTHKEDEPDASDKPKPKSKKRRRRLTARMNETFASRFNFYMADMRRSANSVERLCRTHDWASPHAELRGMLKLVKRLEVIIEKILAMPEQTTIFDEIDGTEEDFDARLDERLPLNVAAAQHSSESHRMEKAV